MALKMNWVSNRLGLEATDAYWKITSFGGSKEGIYYSLEAFADAEAAHCPGAGSIDSYSGSFVPLLEGDNFITQAYLHAKSQQMFASAMDC